MNQQTPGMSYDQVMSQRWPAVLSVREDVNSDRRGFDLAHRSQVAREWHSDPSVKSQVEAFVGNERRQRVNTLPSASNSIYEPLVGAAEIRVFELLPARSGQPIRGTLHHVSVDFSVEHEGKPTDFAVSVSEATLVCYTALSYVWGTGSDRAMESKIEIDKKSIDITNSLSKAICCLRSEKDSVMLWVDQICINQQDQAEKEAQIKLMSLIYSRALNAVIWLGDTSTQDAFDAIHDLEINLTSHYGPLLAEREKKISESREYKAIEELLNNPWFQRTWTTQEACLSNEPWVMAGASRCHWEDCFGMAAVNERLGLFRESEQSVSPAMNKTMQCNKS